MIDLRLIGELAGLALLIKAYWPRRSSMSAPAESSPGETLEQKDLRIADLVSHVAFQDANTIKLLDRASRAEHLLDDASVKLEEALHRAKKSETKLTKAEETITKLNKALVEDRAAPGDQRRSVRRLARIMHNRDGVWCEGDWVEKGSTLYNKAYDAKDFAVLENGKLDLGRQN